MKRFIMMGIACVLSAGLFQGCSDMRYDTSEGFDKDITLFAEEISVPVGSIGPITVESLLMQSSIGKMLSAFMTVKEDGSFELSTTNKLFSINVHRLEKEAGDVSNPFTYKAGDRSASVSGVVSMLGLMGLKTLEQNVTIMATNPLGSKVPFRATFGLTCGTSYSKSTPLDLSLAGMSTAPYAIHEFALPVEIRDVVTEVSLKSLEMDMPEHPVDKIYDDTQGDVFAFSSKHTCKLGVGETFSLPYKHTLKDTIAIGKYQLSACDATIELENTLPLAVTINSIQVLKNVETDEVDDNITITPDITIAGGSPSAPGVTNLKLHVAAKTGTIPDIHGLKIDLVVKAQPGSEGVVLSGKQGLYVKSSSAKVSGGITIPLN